MTGQMRWYKKGNLQLRLDGFPTWKSVINCEEREREAQGLKSKSKTDVVGDR